jgi:hypothetical protein
MLSTVPIIGAKRAPCTGAWTGVTTSAGPTNFSLAAVVSDGTA